jgi:hypothetical protein
MPGKSDIRTIDNKIEITILTDEKEVEELKGFIQSMPPVPPIEEDKPKQDEIISGCISQYINKDASAIPGILDMLSEIYLQKPSCRICAALTF